MKFSPRFLMKLSAKISCEVSFSRHMSPKMTDFHLIPSSADDGTLRGFPFWEVFRHAAAGPPITEAPPVSLLLSGWKGAYFSSSFLREITMDRPAAAMEAIRASTPRVQRFSTWPATLPV